MTTIPRRVAMSTVRAPSNLPDLVKTAFNRAKVTGDLHYYATQFQLRFSPALANKPTAPRPKPSTPSKPFDPFESPENGPLFVAEVAPAHNLVLNKFAVVPEHFILATKEFEDQTHLLQGGDLSATYSCIEAYHEHHKGERGNGSADGDLFAFFNSGSHSGASQPHRHIQLLPVARMREGLGEGPNWSVLADRLVMHGEAEVEVDGEVDPPDATAAAVALPFATFARRIGPEMGASDLHEVYLSLYRQAVDAVRQNLGPTDISPAESEKEHATVINGEAEISYNMAMTRSVLAICPRLAEGSTLTAQDGEVIGKLSLNGTVLAGTALVKSDAEWNALQKDGGPGAGALADVLGKIGVPRIAAATLGVTGDDRGRL